MNSLGKQKNAFRNPFAFSVIHVRQLKRFGELMWKRKDFELSISQ